jgi:hypothetical protein
VGQEDKRWDPLPPGVYYWPDNITRSYELESSIRAYGTEEFRNCANGALVEGVEKIAFYLNPYGFVEHVARQLPDGRWTSKIGDHEDITHASIDALSGDEYGQARHFMERERKVKTESDEAKEVIPAASSESESDRQADVSNPNHREDFTRLVGEAARKREQED